MEEPLRQFISDHFLYGQRVRFSDDDSLIEHGLIDSTGILELISFVEQQYGIDVSEEELVPDNLDSINRLKSFIARKQAAFCEGGRALAS